MNLHHAPIAAMLLAGALAFHAPVASAALPDYGLKSAAGATGTATSEVDDTSEVKVIGTSFSATAQTDYGTNGAKSMSASPNTLAYSGSLWWDRYTISGGTGAGSVDFSAALKGSLNAVGAGAGVGYVLVISSSLPASLEFDYSSLLPANASTWPSTQPFDSATVLASYVDSVNGLASKTVDETFAGSFGFTYGTPFYIGAALLTTAGGVSGTATADFLNSATFNLTLNAGDTLTVASIPEPGEWAMLLVGLGLVGLRLKGRRKQIG